MSHIIDPVEHHFAGDSIIFGPYTVKRDGEPKDISSDELEWYLFEDEYESDPNNAVLSHTDSGVEIAVPDGGSKADGEWQVKVTEGTTSDFVGKYWQRAVVDPPDGSKLTWKGSINISQ